ncbi:protein tyrosine phosphatase 52F isoform 2-T5 [Glossina fuscipes fuscipes]
MHYDLYLQNIWKFCPPPIHLQAKIILFLIFVLLNCYESQTLQAVEKVGENTERVDVQIEATANSIKFSLVDTQSYEFVNITCKNIINNSVTQADDEHVCNKLKPCCTYLALLSIKILHKDEDVIEEQTEEVRTKYLVPEVRILSAEPYAESIILYWYSKNPTCISTYEIEAKSQEKDFQWTLTNDKTFLLMTNLLPCSQYNIQLKTFDIEKVAIGNEKLNSSTRYLAPGSIILNFMAFDNGQIKAFWKPPSHWTCIEYYYLKWSLQTCSQTAAKTDDIVVFTETTIPPSEQCEWSFNLTDITANEYVLTNLQGCENYTLEVFINNDRDLIGASSFISAEQVPGPVIIKDISPGETTAIVAWQNATTHHNCVELYQVEIVGPAQRSDDLQERFKLTTNQTEAVFERLDPCGKYNVSIVPQTKNGTKGYPVDTQFTTLEGRPSEILSPFAAAEPHRLLLSWMAPAYADLCLTGYRLSGWNDEKKPVPAFDKTTENTSVTIDGLNSCQGFTVQIIPTTKTSDGDLTHVEARTTPIRAQPPTVETTSVYPNRLEFSAQESDLNNKCETIFARFVCEARHEARHKFAEIYVEGRMGIIYNTAVGPLSPFIDYICSVSLFNVAGWSHNKTVIKRTEPYYPDPPEKLSLKTHSNHSLGFSWNQPKYANGNIKLYVSHFQRVEAAFYIPAENCKQITTESITRETSGLEQIFDELTPYTRYSIQVAAQNEFGIGEYTRPYTMVTKPGVSDPVIGLKAKPEGPLEWDAEYHANALIAWNMSCKSNGEVEHFLLEFIGERPGYDFLGFTRKVKPDFSKKGSFLHNETNLAPQYTYTVRVSVKIKSVDEFSEPVNHTFEAPAGIPQRLNAETIGKSRIEAVSGNHPAKSVAVRLPTDILNDDLGTIIYVALLLSQKDCDEGPELKCAAMNTIEEWPDIPSWSEANGDQNKACIAQYQTTPLRWEPNVNQYRSVDMVEFVIGLENCETSSKKYCNGPLRPDTEYNLVVRLFTKSGYNDAGVLTFRTEALIELVIILVSVSSCLILALVAGLIYYWITKRIKWQRESCHGLEDSVGDVVEKNFAIYYREISKADKLAREFKELTAVAIDLSYAASEMGGNKNRYADIFPYDKNRVILDIDADGSDYINASFIDGYRRRKEYIATQGPKSESIKDFWRMVLQHNVRIIVMVTQFREGDVIKCHEYFPFKFKGINVVIKKKESFDIYDRTELSVTHETFGLKQKVVHFYFKKWPDHGCPTDPMYLINFVRKVKSEKKPSYSPIVVHCSAGVGRTGTYIGLDIIMQRLKNESKINIYETVKKLRFQRMKMVQTLTQYTFLYDCAYELVKHKYNHNTANGKKEIADNDIDDHEYTFSRYAMNLRKQSADILPSDERHFTAKSPNDNISLEPSAPTYVE